MITRVIMSWRLIVIIIGKNDWVSVECGGESVDLFPVSSMKTNQSPQAVFEQVNSIIDGLPSTSRLEIFEFYKNSKEVISRTTDEVRRAISLKRLVNYFYTNWRYSGDAFSILTWVDKHIHELMPSCISETFEELPLARRRPDDESLRTRTYIRSDYRELIALCILLKPMIPVWIMYGDAVDSLTAMPLQVEHECMTLLEGTDWVKEPISPLTRLLNYVKNDVESNRRTPPILSFLGSDMMDEWHMAYAIVRRMVYVDLAKPEEGGNNMAIVVYNALQSLSKNLEKKFTGTAVKHRPKLKDIPAPSTKSEKDIASSYRPRENRAIGDAIFPEWYARNFHNIVGKFESLFVVDLDESMLVEMRRDTKRADVLDVNIGGPQTVVLKWLLSPVISPKNLILSQATMVDVMITVQYILHRMGLVELPLLMLAEEAVDREGRPIGGYDSRARVSQADAEIFSRTHPYSQSRGGRVGEGYNTAVAAIDSLFKKFTVCDWRIPETVYQQSVYAGGSLLDQAIAKDGYMLSAHPAIKGELATIVKCVNNIS